MAKVIDFSAFRQEEQDLYGLDYEGLAALREELRRKIALLDEQEPRNMMSEAYEVWGDCREALEDQLDEVMDRMDELE